MIYQDHFGKMAARLVLRVVDRKAWRTSLLSSPASNRAWRTTLPAKQKA